jgi:hypothetical protein
LHDKKLTLLIDEFNAFFYYNLILILKMFLKGALYYKLENATVGMAPKIRKMGRNLFKQGNDLQGASAHKDYLVPSLRCVPISNSKYPKTLDADWVAPNAVLIGDI